MEGSRGFPLGPPEEHQHTAHKEKLIHVIPGLHHHLVEPSHQVLVIQTADGSQQGGQYHKPNPPVVLEVDTLLLARTAQQEKRNDGQQHSNPLIQVQALAEYQQSTHQSHDRTGSIDRSHNGERQMFHTEIPEGPRRKDNHRFQKDIPVYLPPGIGHEENGLLQPFRTEMGNEDER